LLRWKLFLSGRI